MKLFVQIHIIFIQLTPKLQLISHCIKHQFMSTFHLCVGGQNRLRNYQLELPLSSNCKTQFQSGCQPYMMELSVLKSSTVLIDISLTICDELNLTDINSSTNMSDTKDDKLDDFREIFDPIGTRIIYIVFWIIYVTLTNAFFILTVLYEKYGADIMKRSIDNRLLAQALLVMIFYNSVCSTIFLMRFIFGPLPFWVAAFESYVANCWISWELLLLTEISVVKALLIYKLTWVWGINENFAGRFLLRFNLGYILISHTGRFVHKYFMQFRFESYDFLLNLIFIILEPLLVIFLNQFIFDFCQASNLVLYIRYSI